MNLTDAKNLHATIMTMARGPSQKIRLLPFFGTLLGLVRDGDIIPNDDDLDFLVPLEDKQKAQMLIVKLGLKVTSPVWAQNFLQGQIGEGADRVVVDFYFCHEDENGNLVLPWSFVPEQEDQSLWLKLDLEKSIEIQKSNFLFERIDNSTKISIVEYLYGPDWTTPKTKNLHYRTVVENNAPKIIPVRGLEKARVRIQRARQIPFLIARRIGKKYNH